MARTAEHTHRIRVRETQMEMHPDGPVGSSPLADDYEGRLEAAQQQLERLQQQAEELERRKRELEEMSQRKRAFLTSQAELTEKLGNTITRIDRELYGIRQELEDLEQARQCFAGHLARIGKFDPEAWSRQNVGENLERALAAIALAEEEYQQAARHFEGLRSGVIFGGGRRRATAGGGEFFANLRNGLAFNLPLVILAVVALVVYYLNQS